MTLYECGGCGHVRTDDSYCRVCGEDEYFEAVDVGYDSAHVCETCGESFDSAQGLRSHQRVHADDEE